MIVRDQYGIIIQHNERGTVDPSYMDGGDSARSTGIMALCENYEDRVHLQLFFKFETCDPVRHPYQKPYNDPKEMSRDQLICLSAGCYEPTSTVASRSLAKWYDSRKSWFLNNDLLSPSHWFHIYCCCHVDRNADLRTILFRYISAVFLLADILWSTKIKPNAEQNQIQCMVIVRGKWWLNLYCKLHPDWKKSVRDYFDSWRDQHEIGEALIKKVQETISEPLPHDIIKNEPENPVSPSSGLSNDQGPSK